MKKIIDQYTDLPYSAYKKYYLRHRDERLAAKKRYYLANTEKELERSRIWRDQNPEIVKGYYHNNKILKS